LPVITKLESMPQFEAMRAGTKKKPSRLELQHLEQQPRFRKIGIGSANVKFTAKKKG
jgi:hypothetical protein